MTSEPRVILQSDWNEAIIERKSKAWISFNHEGQKTVYSDMYGINDCKSLSKKFKITTKDGFKAQLVSQKNICVEYDDKINGKVVSLEFQAPSVTFSCIHDYQTPVIDMAVNNENLAVSVDSGGVAKIWETETGTVRRVLNGHHIGACRAKFFPSGRVVLTGGQDFLLKVWAVDTGLCAATFTGHRGAITDMAIVGIGRNFISTSTDGTAKLWDCGTQRCLTTFDDIVSPWNCCTLGKFEGEQHGSSLQSPVEEVDTASKMLLVGTESSHLISFGVQDRQKIFDFKCSSAVNCVSFVDENLFVAGTEGGCLYLIDKRNTEEPVKMQQEARGCMKSLYQCDNGIIISTGDGSCYQKDHTLSTVLEFTGSDIDPVYRVCGRRASVQPSSSATAGARGGGVGGARGASGTGREKEQIYACSRDGSVRKYVNNGNK